MSQEDHPSPKPKPGYKTYEWEMGYNYLGPKCRNPFHKDSKEYGQWEHGWLTRFYGEMI